MSSFIGILMAIAFAYSAVDCFANGELIATAIFALGLLAVLCELMRDPSR